MTISTKTPRTVTKKSLWRRLAIIGGWTMALYGAAGCWARYDFRSGWGEFYRQHAVKIRADVARGELSPAELEEYLVAAQLSDLVAVKYWRAAFRPWAAMDGPLVDRWDLAEASDDVKRMLAGR